MFLWADTNKKKQAWVRLLKLSTGARGIGQNSFGCLLYTRLSCIHQGNLYLITSIVWPPQLTINYANLVKESCLLAATVWNSQACFGGVYLPALWYSLTWSTCWWLGHHIFIMSFTRPTPYVNANMSMISRWHSLYLHTMLCHHCNTVVLERPWFLTALAILAGSYPERKRLMWDVNIQRNRIIYR